MARIVNLRRRPRLRKKLVAPGTIVSSAHGTSVATSTVKGHFGIIGSAAGVTAVSGVANGAVGTSVANAVATGVMRASSSVGTAPQGQYPLVQGVSNIAQTTGVTNPLNSDTQTSVVGFSGSTGTAPAISASIATGTVYVEEIANQVDFENRIKSLLPPSWFEYSSGTVLDIPIAGMSYGLLWIYIVYLYVIQQSRIQTATDVWLDRIAYDFFGSKLPRLLNEQDSNYSARIRAEIVKQRQTRSSISESVDFLTGTEPKITELWNPGDTGAYGVTTDTASIVSNPSIVLNASSKQSIFVNTLFNGPPISLSVKFKTNSTNAAILGSTRSSTETSFPDSNNYEALLYVGEGGFLQGGWYDGSVETVTSTKTVNDGEFHHAVITFASSSVIQLYLDNASQGTQATANLESQNNFWIGTASADAWPNLSGNDNFGHGDIWFTGEIADVRVFNRVITAAEVQTLYNGGTVSSGLVGWYVDASGADISGNGNGGIANGSPTTGNDGPLPIIAQVAQYSNATQGYGVAGMYGSLKYNNQFLVTAYRPNGEGVPGIPGYGTVEWGYGVTGEGEYCSLNQIVARVLDSDIYANIAQMLGAGNTAWTAILTPPDTIDAPLAYFGNINNSAIAAIAVSFF